MTYSLPANPDQFVADLLSWYDFNHADLPWRGHPDPYAVWVSEIMLQQTQITTVIPYFERWMARFPTVQKLADASLDEVLKVWEGLGYYSRARNLHAAAGQVVTEFGGDLPETAAELMKLKGIGRYTAGAIASICFDQATPVLDGNVIRVLTRLGDIADDISLSATRKNLWALAAKLVPADRPGDYNQALMELGQRVCLPHNPMCLLCPVRVHCLAAQRGTQPERPVRPPRRNIPHYDVVAGIIWQTEKSPQDGGRFLIAQRPLDGLLGGLWEFPGGKVEREESHAGALRREIEEELGLAITVGTFQVEVRHAYTHFRITLHAYHAHYEGEEVQHLGVIDHAWVRLGEVDNYAFAVTDRKIIDSLLNS